jgi:MFS family permease
MAAAVTLIGLGQGVWTIIAASTAAEFGPAGFGRAFGLMSMLTPVATIAAPLVAWLSEQGVAYSESLVGLGAFGLVGFAAAFFIAEQPFGPRRLAKISLQASGSPNVPVAPAPDVTP